jgi:hypothetical protein
MPGVSVEVFTEDNLLVSDEGLESIGATILSGQNVVRGALMGKVTLNTTPTITPDGGNTGNGATSNFAAGDKLKVGTYKLICVNAEADAGVFACIDPDGIALEPIIVGDTDYNNGHFEIDLADGATDWAIGDSIDVVIAAGSGKWVLSLSTAVDGSQVPRGVLADDADASAADKLANIYIAGKFDQRALTYGASHTFSSVVEALREKNIYLRDSVAA